MKIYVDAKASRQGNGSKEMPLNTLMTRHRWQWPVTRYWLLRVFTVNM